MEQQYAINGLDHYFTCKALTALLETERANQFGQFTKMLKIARTRAKHNKSFGLSVNYSI